MKEYRVGVRTSTNTRKEKDKPKFYGFENAIKNISCFMKSHQVRCFRKVIKKDIMKQTIY